MMPRAWATGRIGRMRIIAACLIGAAGLMLCTQFTQSIPTAYRAAQLAAAERMAKIEAVIKDAVIREGIPIEPEDVNQTGLIGPEWTELTTTLGQLEAKRSSLNPDFAALMVRYFVRAGLGEGDAIAVGASGSFPGLALATMAAATELGLEARVIASFGASMYGATRPALTVPKMLRIARDAGLIEYELLATSPGGHEDRGESALYDNARDVIAQLAAEAGAPFIDPATIEESIERRLALYGDDVKCFVNVGGASPNSGTSAYTLDFPNGLVLDPPRIPGTKNRGLMYEYAARGVPVVHLLNVRQLCLDYGLGYDPVPLPEPGTGGVYWETSYPRALAVGAVVLAIAALLVPAGRRTRRTPM